MDPFVQYHSSVIGFWARAVWVGRPGLGILQTVLKAAADDLERAKNLWASAASPAHVFLLSIQQLGWGAPSADRIVIDTGEEIQLTHLAPKQVVWLARRAARNVSDVAALDNMNESSQSWTRPIFWRPLAGLLEGRTSDSWTARHQNSLRSLIAQQHWCQAKQARHNKSDTDLCQVCKCKAGTLWHRRFLCPHWEADRARHCSPRLLRCASVLQLAGQDLEKAACGIFPMPLELVPRPLWTHECEIIWIKKPEEGVLTGHLFTDGSGLHPKCPLARRAGWSLTQLNDDGTLKGAVCGAVAWQLGPFQTARDGEDVACLQAARGLATGVCTFHIDCQGTVDALNDKTFSSSVRHSRCHLWEEFHRRMPEATAVKVKAHLPWAAVDQGIISEYDWSGNRVADIYAGQGVQQHPDPTDSFNTLEALSDIAREFARWAATQEVLIAEREDYDALPLPPRAASDGEVGGKPTKQTAPRLRKDKQPPKPMEPEVSQELHTLAALQGHVLRQADVFLPSGLPPPPPKSSTVLTCAACGGYAWEAVLSLAKPCSSWPNTETLRRQRNRSIKLNFPCGSKQYCGWTVGAWRAPTPQAIIDLLAPKASRLAWKKAQCDFLSPNVAVWGEAWGKDVIALAFGLSEQGLEDAMHDKADEARRQAEESRRGL